LLKNSNEINLYNFHNFEFKVIIMN
jgi:hypothetical protein